MIPRFKPYFSCQEIGAALMPDRNSVELFEKKFADVFNSKYAVSFQYGRSALYAILKAQSIDNAEIIIPAYTCVVIANAIVESGNIPVFVEVSEKDFNMLFDDIIAKVTEKTRAVIITNLFGYPFKKDNIRHLKNVLNDDILLIQDCALAFGTLDEGEPVNSLGDAAIYGMNLGKQICSVQGGMATTDNPKIYETLREIRNTHLTNPGVLKSLFWFVYFLASYAGFSKAGFNLTYFLSEHTHLLDRLTQYYREDEIDVPKDFLEKLTGIQARIGTVQLRKFAEIIRKRIKIAEKYNDRLKDVEGITLPPLIDGATYSHYVIRTANREKFLRNMVRSGVNCGTLFDYEIPSLQAYLKFRNGDFPVSDIIAKKVVNLPNYPGLSAKDQSKIIEAVRKSVTM